MLIYATQGKNTRKINHISSIRGTVVIAIVWLFELKLPIQSVFIINNVMSSNPTHGEVYSIQQYVIK